jgi:hypothetical protein
MEEKRTNSSLIIERIFTSVCEEFCVKNIIQENLLEVMQPHAEELVLYMIQNLGSASLEERNASSQFTGLALGYALQMLGGEIFVKHLNVIVEAIIYHIKTSHTWLAICFLHFTKGLILNYK